MSWKQPEREAYASVVEMTKEWFAMGPILLRLLVIGAYYNIKALIMGDE